MKEIIIDVSEQVEVKIETRGFSGKACAEESKFLKDPLEKELSQQLAPAYYQTQTGKKKESVKKHPPLCG